MNNYVYIVSCLPVLTPDATLDADAVIEDVLSQCSERDRETISFLLDGFDGEKLSADFYRKALSHPSAFIRGWFGYDLDVRNAKARYLNRAFGRPEEMDTVVLGEDEEREFDDAPLLQGILSTEDILGREKALDDLVWKKIDELTVFDYFDLDAILGFLAKLKITDRWLKLDPATGRELFRRFTEEVRATFKGVDFEG
jgi:hypothetical protein